MKGRLLTISSSEEEQFIQERGSGKRLWMAGWRPPNRQAAWRDERGRTLKYLGTWAPRQPDTWRNIQWHLAIVTSQDFRGWDDVEASGGELHACIEWGEEYPK